MDTAAKYLNHLEILNIVQPDAKHLKYFLKYFKLNKTNPQMGDNILHARLVTIHHRLAAVFKKELNIRRRRFIAIRRDDHVLILEA